MKDEVMKGLIDQAFSTSANKICFCFQGGEPTLAGIDYYQRFIQYVKQIPIKKEIEYTIQTNGLLIDEEWIELFKQNHFLVGISLDGFMENHNHYRKANQPGTYQRVMDTIKLLDKHLIDYNILTVLTHGLASKPKELYQFYKENKFQYIQLIPCLPSLDGMTHEDALKPADFYSFYKTFFDLWYQDLLKGEYISIRLFDDLIMMYCGIAPGLCGMLGHCQMQWVIESNGNVYPCDFYALDDYCLGNIMQDSLDAIYKNKLLLDFIHEKRTMSKLCSHCSYYHMCYGYCKRMNICLNNDKYCGYQQFLSYSQDKLYSIAQGIKKGNIS